MLISRFTKLTEVSLFVDESGDFGQYSIHSPYYLFSVVLHEQDKNIINDIAVLNKKITEHGFDIHAIHTGPIVRNEGYYQKYDFTDRKKLFNDLLFFAKSIDINYHVFCIDKKECKNSSNMVEKLSKQFAEFIKADFEYFSSFDKVIVYYDYGQSEITTILTSVLNSLLSRVEFRHMLFIYTWREQGLVFVIFKNLIAFIGNPGAFLAP